MRKIVITVVFILLYILLGNGRLVSTNPAVPEMTIAVNMIVPVLAGIILGRMPGLLTGLFGTALNWGVLRLIGSGSAPFELLAILPHAVMGYVAGCAASRFSLSTSSLSIAVGHILNILAFMSFGMLPASLLIDRTFLIGIGVEIFIGAVAVIILAAVFDLATTKHPRKKKKQKQLVMTSNQTVWKIMIVVLLGLIIFFSVLFYFSTLFMSFVVGGALILMTEKLRGNFRKRTKAFSRLRKILTASTYVLFWTLIIIGLMYTSLNEMAEAFTTLDEEGQDLGHTYLSRLEPLLPAALAESIADGAFLEQMQRYIVNFFSGIIGSFGSFLLASVLVIPLMFYGYFRRKEAWLKNVISFLPKRAQKRVRSMVNDIGTEMHDFFTAKIVQSLVVGAVCCLGFFVAGIKGWLFLGLLAGFLNIIPYLGPVLGLVAPLLIGLLDSPIVALAAIITVIIAQIVDNFYLTPFLISERVYIDPLVTIVLIFVGARMLGAMGMVFSIPVYLVAKIIIKETYQEAFEYYCRR